MIAIVLASAGLLYGVACGIALRRGRVPDARGGAAFACGIALAAAVLVGPMDGLADASLAWHMVQHLALAFVVAPLVLLGAPIRLALAALPNATAARIARALHSAPVRLVTNPAFAWLQFTAVLYGVHFSPLYQAALEHPALHAVEHAVFFTSALVFWTPVLAVAPAPHAPAHPVRLLMLFLALPMSAFLGFVLYVTRGVLYAHYAARPNAVADQANAGAVMWIAGCAPLLVALLWCVADWGARERHVGALVDRLERT